MGLKRRVGLWIEGEKDWREGLYSVRGHLVVISVTMD